MFSFLKKNRKDSVTNTRNIDNIKISVIMPVYLGDYNGAASDRESKFKAAVISFVRQTYENKELIIISDGCYIAEKVYKDYLQYKGVRFLKIDKQPLFSGKVREEGLKEAIGDVICYLDSDDLLGENHLSYIINSFSDPALDYIYYNDMLLPPNQQPIPRNVELKHGSVGTSSFAHRKYANKSSWIGCDGYGHDWQFISKFIANNGCGKKIYGAEYYVCHVPHIF